MAAGGLVQFVGVTGGVHGHRRRAVGSRDQQILILDEPFNGLDATSVERVRNLLLEFRDEGRSIIFTSHNADDMTLLADRHWLINNQTLQALQHEHALVRMQLSSGHLPTKSLPPWAGSLSVRRCYA